MEYNINHKKLSECMLYEIEIYNNDIPFDLVLEYMKNYYKLEYTETSKINYRTKYNDYHILIKHLDIYVGSYSKIFRHDKYLDKKIITRDITISKILNNT